MLIEEVDKLKDWLTNTLAPICDADPLTLAKYVVALVRKDKTEAELRELCLRELDVFLQEKTKDFIETLFLTLKDKLYLPGGAALVRKPPVSLPPAAQTPPTITASTDPSSIPVLAVTALQTTSNAGDTNTQSQDDFGKKSTEETPEEANQKPPRPRSRSRSRSPYTRNRSPGLRTRSPVRDLRERLDRDDRIRRRYPDRRFDYDRAPPRRHQNRYDSHRRRRSPHRQRSWSRSWSRSRSRDRFTNRGRTRSRSRSHSPGLRRSPGGRRSPAGRRSRSPVGRRSRSPGGRRSRSPGGRRSPAGRRLPGSRRSRSPVGRRSPGGRRTPPWRSPGQKSPDKRSRSRSQSGGSRGGSPRSRRKPSSRSSTPPDYALPPKLEPPAPTATTSYPPPPMVRCRDYDEKGFCMRGDLCPYDHGKDPVVVDDVHLPNVLGFSGQPPQEGREPPPVGPPPPVRMPGGLPPGPNLAVRPPPHLPPRMPPPSQMAVVLPTTTHTGPPGPFPTRPGPPPRPPNTVGQRPPPPPPPGTVPVNVPLINQDFRVVSAPDPPYNPEAPDIQNPPPSRGWRPPNPATRPGFFTQNRTHADVKSEDRREVVTVSMPAEKRLGPPKHNTNNTTLEVRKIPRELNTIAKVNEHFTKFGTIVNLQVHSHGDPEAATVTFASHAQASAAYRSSEPLFNNRFIKIFWHRPDQAGEDVRNPPGGVPGRRPGPSIKDRLGAIPPAHKLQLNNVKTAATSQSKEAVIVSPTGSVSKTVFNPSAVVLPKPAQLKLSNKPYARPATLAASTSSRSAAHTDKHQAALSKKLQIANKKKEILQQQIANQKALLDKLQKQKNLSAEDKATIIKTVKLLDSKISGLKSELEESLKSAKRPAPTPTPAVSTQVSAPVARQQAQKAILDTELDIMNRESEGADTSDLKQKVLQLKREAASMGLLRTSQPGVGPGFHGYGTGKGRGALSVDRRPREVCVMGFSLDDRQDVLSHMKAFGPVTKSLFDDDAPSMTLTYQKRVDAEQAVSIGPVFKGAVSLSVTWALTPIAPAISPVEVDNAALADSDDTHPAQGQAESTIIETTDNDAALNPGDTGLDVGDAELSVGDTELNLGDTVLDEELEDYDESELLGEEDEDEDEQRSWRR